MIKLFKAEFIIQKLKNINKMSLDNEVQLHLLTKENSVI